MALKSYRDLTVLQKAMDLAVATYLPSTKFPQKESYGLASQVQRAAVSIPSNIAKGYARSHRATTCITCRSRLARLPSWRHK